MKQGAEVVWNARGETEKLATFIKIIQPEENDGNYYQRGIALILTNEDGLLRVPLDELKESHEFM